MMPEMRTYINEDLTPMSEAELQLAICDVKQRCQVDDDRIFLHSNCSGAYRALQFAELHPEQFAAIALYAPLYERLDDNRHVTCLPPKKLLRNLRTIPILIHYDPLDSHSPYYQFKDLITDCRKEGVPLTVSAKRNSGELYNVTLAGEEALFFFKDKTRRLPLNIDCNEPQIKNTQTIADFYAKPFLYVYHKANNSSDYKDAVDSIRTEYEHYFFSPLPLKADTDVSMNDLKERNLFLIGDSFTGIYIRRLLNLILDDGFENYDNKNVQAMHLFENPLSDEHNILVYHLSANGQYKHAIHRSWLLFSKHVIAGD